MEKIIENLDFADSLLRKYIGVTRPSYYAGRGPCRGDLDGHMLYGIFLELNNVNEQYGRDFVFLVDSIPLIGATEFINAFNGFARNGFVFEKENIDCDRLDIEGKTKEEERANATLYAMGGLGLFKVCRTAEQEKEVSDSIKESFYKRVRDYYDPNGKYDYYKAVKAVYDRDEESSIDELFFVVDKHFRESLLLWNGEESIIKRMKNQSGIEYKIGSKKK